MTPSDSQVPWTDEQWALVRQAVQKEANRSRVAATFLPLYGPLAGDADFVKSGELNYIDTPFPLPTSNQRGPGSKTISVDEHKTIPLTTLQVRVLLHGAQMADTRLTSALEMFRRASNVLARLEDAIVFRGQTGQNEGPPKDAIEGLRPIWTVRGGGRSGGLFGRPEGDDDEKPEDVEKTEFTKRAPATKTELPGKKLIHRVSEKIGKLEKSGHFGPFALVLGQTLFANAHEASDALLLPSDRIIPFLGGGPMLRSSTLPSDQGIIVALGAAPVELVVATDVSVGFLQVTTDPLFVFRVFEKIALRIKESDAVVRLEEDSVSSAG
jgi:uncharacterized linocin/CFP29 family protein